LNKFESATKFLVADFIKIIVVKSLLIGLVLMMSALVIQAQQQLTIKLTDAETGMPISQGNIACTVEGKIIFQTQTENTGKAIIYTEQKSCKVQITALQYHTKSFDFSKEIKPEIEILLTPKIQFLSEYVVTGQSVSVKPSNAMSIIKTIPSAVIKAQGAVTLNDVLANQLNMNISEDGLLGSKIRMMGLGGDKVKILIDGMPLNGRENGNIDLSQISLSNTERIEIVQGPMSVVYGSDALGGVINIISKKQNDVFKAEVNTFYESVGKFNVNALLTKSFNKHQFTFTGGRNFFEGWHYLDTSAVRRNLLFKPKEQYVAGFNYGYTTASGINIKFSSDNVLEKISNRGTAFINPFKAYALDEYYHNYRSINRLQLDGKWSETLSWQAMTGLSYYHRTRNRYYKDLVTLQENLTSGIGDQDTSTFWEMNARGNIMKKIYGTELTLGYDLNSQFGESKKIPVGQKNMQEIAGFSSFKFPLFYENLSAMLGLRIAKNSIYSSPIIPTINLMYQPTKKISFRTSYAKGFRAPSLKELYLDFVDQNHDVAGNEQLRAEKADHFQASMSFMFWEKSGDYLQLLTTSIYNNLNDAIGLVKVDPNNANDIRYKYFNINTQRNFVQSVELEGQLRTLHFKVGYALNHFLSTNTYSDFNTNELASTLMYYWEKPKVNISLFHKFIGAQPFLMPTIEGDAVFNGQQKEYQLFDASFQRKWIKDRLDITIGLKNIFDVRNLSTTGVATSSAHGGDGNTNFLPRRVFLSVRYLLK